MPERRINDELDGDEVGPGDESVVPRELQQISDFVGGLAMDDLPQGS